MKPKSCTDDECDQKYSCYRWRGEGQESDIRHGIDPDGGKYCNYFITKDLYEKILIGVEKIINRNPDYSCH